VNRDMMNTRERCCIFLAHVGAASATRLTASASHHEPLMGLGGDNDGTTVVDFRAAEGAISGHSHGSSADGDPMIRKLRNFLALAGATAFACWNLAIAQTPMPPCLAVDTSAPPTCDPNPGGAARFLGNSMQGTTLTAYNAYGNGQWLKFVGADTKYGNVLPRYPASPWGGSAGGMPDSIQQIWTSVGQGATTEAVATDNTVPAGVSNRVLVSTMVSAYVSPNQDTYQIQPSTSAPQGMIYTSRWLWLQGDIASRGGFGWMLLSEFKTPDPGSERFGVQVINQSWTGYSQPVFNFKHDNTATSPFTHYLDTFIGPNSVTAGNSGIGQTHACPVPLGRWFKLEFAFNRYDSSGEGWMWAAVTDPGSSDPALQAGVQIFAARGPLTFSDGSYGTETLGLNRQRSDPINRIYLHEVYSDIARSAGSPYVIKMTDMQVYSGWPSDATAHPTNYQ
jgi:hypothetical protein